MLINFFFTTEAAYAQGGLDQAVTYEARDSIVANVPEQIVTLYGEAIVNYDNIELTADYIQININNNEVTATYSTDSLGNAIGKPFFKADGEESRCDYIKYNFDTKKAYIKEVRAQQDEGYIHMGESKLHPNEYIHLKDGKFTTCENDTPHYHFKLTKAIIVPDKRVVTGPVFMKIFNIPTPLAAPFAFFPNSKSKKHGIILPSFSTSSRYGFGLQDFGYYIPLGDYWETQFNATVFTTGRFGIGNTTNYMKKYKHRGSVNLKFEQFRGQFYDTTLQNKATVRWTHTQDPKAHPSMNFSGNINFQSDNNGKSSLETINPDYFTNQFNSAISLDKRWNAGRFNGNASIKASLQQSSLQQQYTINLPEVNFTISRFDLGVLRKNKIGSKWYEEVNVQYGLKSKNFIAAPDSIFNLQDYQQIGDYAINGIAHNITLNSNLKLAGGRMTFTPSVNYNESWNFQYENYQWDPQNQKIDTLAVTGFGSHRNLRFNGGLAGNFYGIFKWKGEKGTRFKHVASPSLSFSYSPDLGSHQLVQIDSTGEEQYLSSFSKSLYTEGRKSQAGIITFNLMNTLKMKTRDMKDTVNLSDKSFNLVDAFSIGGNYDIFKDSMNMSDISMQFRTAKFLKIFSFQSSASFSPYRLDTLGYAKKEYAIGNNQGLGNLKTAKVVVNANFTNRTGRKKQQELNNVTANNATLNEQVTNPNKVNFEIPWQLNVSYNLNYVRNLKSLVTDPDFNLVQTMRVNGDFSINKKWKFTYLVNADLQQFNEAYQQDTEKPYKNLISTYSFEVWRDLHCWEAVLQFAQYGPWEQQNFTFLFRVNIKASMFQDIKLELNQPPFF
ncbi:MAG: putative LPS assembly protein LptD [Crocinitomicaceae bacterium]